MKLQDVLTFAFIMVFFSAFAAICYKVESKQRVDYWSVSQQRCVDCINCDCSDVKRPGPLTIYVQ